MYVCMYNKHRDKINKILLNLIAANNSCLNIIKKCFYTSIRHSVFVYQDRMINYYQTFRKYYQIVFGNWSKSKKQWAR